MILFFNGNILTMDSRYAYPQAVLVGDNGKIRWMGKFEELPTSQSFGKLKQVDLKGHTLIPGFNDAHVHIWKLGLLLTTQVDARGDAAPTITEITARFSERAAATPDGQWITGRGYNEAELYECRHPTRADLDAASQNHPIALTRTCGHMIVANSYALNLAGITRDTPDPLGGVIVRDSAGEPTGLLQETAQGLITRIIPDYDDETLARAIREATYHQLRLGITSATDPLLTPLHLRIYRELEATGDLAIRINGLPIRRPDGGTDTLPLPEMYSSDWLRIDTVKFFADGGLSGATAAVSIPYKETGSAGVLRFETEELIQLMWEAHDAGYRIATHAIGDVAIEQVLSAYETLHRRKPDSGLRHRIEHLGLPTANHLARCKVLNVIAVPQTIFLYALGTTYRRYLPDEFFPQCFPIRAMLDAGLDIALSSDAPVVPDDNPLLGMKAALDRQDRYGEAIAPDQAISAYEALHAYTMGGAIASGDAHNRGSITPGKWADFAVLTGDPLTTLPDELPNLRVVQTYVGGQLVYEA